MLFFFLILENGIECAAYHADVSLKRRQEVHENFKRDLLSVVVATVAFGMGIDKPGKVSIYLKIKVMPVLQENLWSILRLCDSASTSRTCVEKLDWYQMSDYGGVSIKSFFLNFWRLYLTYTIFLLICSERSLHFSNISSKFCNIPLTLPQNFLHNLLKRGWSFNQNLHNISLKFVLSLKCFMKFT